MKRKFRFRQLAWYSTHQFIADANLWSQVNKNQVSEYIYAKEVINEYFFEVHNANWAVQKRKSVLKLNFQLNKERTLDR